MSYTINLYTGTVIRVSDSVQILPSQSATSADVTAYKQWCEAGNSPSIDSTKPQEVIVNEAKAVRPAQIAVLKVTTAGGLVFDADEVSQDRMVRAISALQPLATIEWVLADNACQVISREVLQEALELAITETTNIWTAPYH